MSFANINPSKFDLTPQRITYKGIDLGGSLGNVAINVETTMADLKADQFGDGIIDSRVSGLKMTITTELTQILDHDTWKVVFPFYKRVGTNPYSFYFDSQVGKAASDVSGELILHPLSKADADKSADYKFWKAFATAKATPTYGPTEQARLQLEFMILPDFTSQPARFMLYGDPAIGVVAGSASRVFTGTGNGTMTGLAVGSGTVTETITATVVTTAVNGGIFFVTGSVSGALGLATVGVGFATPQISFLINDGSTDFILGDQFTITATAANYI